MFCFLGLCVSAQKTDYQWLFGYDNYAASDTNFGGVTMDFDSTYPILTRHIRIADMNECNASYCNDSGRLLFYTNGGDIFDGRDSIMFNGDSINYGRQWHEDLIATNERYSGLRNIQGMLALSAPGDSNKAYIIHCIDWLSDFQSGVSAFLVDTTFYSLIDLKGNNGFGQVIKKNQVINNDSLAYGYLSDVKHGNGRDWWIVHPYYINNCYYEFLLTDTGIGLTGVQCIGDSMFGYGDLGTSCFSPDGGKYFWVNSTDGIHMFDFDRCTGVLSNPQHIPFPIPGFGDSITPIAGIAVSPSNQYLYIVGNVMILQYDLLASNIGVSADTVGVFDGTYDIYPQNLNTFFLAQLGPDGKIYINSTNGTQTLHVINRPDQKGDSCLFARHSFDLHTFNESSLPNFPNYRLDALQGSPCDTLSTMTTEVRSIKEKILKVFPNPASDIVTVDYGFTDWNKGAVSLEITDALGQLVYTQSLPMYSGYQRLDVSRFASGLYNVAIKRSGAAVAVAKLVKE